MLLLLEWQRRFVSWKGTEILNVERDTDLKSALVVGASGGLGEAITNQLIADESYGTIYALSRRAVSFDAPGVASKAIDIESEQSIGAAMDGIESLDLVFVATGFLHDDATQPEKSWRQMSSEGMAKAYAINTIGPALVAKHSLDRLRRDRATCFAVVSARVGSISDNRLGGWYAYRSSKAGLNQLVKTLSIELARKRPSAVCVGLHPGTVDTRLSEPFQSNVADGKLFSPEFSAARLLSVLDSLNSEQSGHVFAWDGSEIAP